MSNNNNDDFGTISRIIKQRQTFKVLGKVDAPVEISAEMDQANRPLVLDAIQTAGWAPFHYDRMLDGIAEPWRTHVLWHDTCRTIAGRFHDWFDDVKPGNKIPPMLSACGAVVLVTWLPQFKPSSAQLSLADVSQDDTDKAALVETQIVETNQPPNSKQAPKSKPITKAKQIAIDEEHLAGASAMVQNLLLLLTAHGMGTYWSSGGQFRTAAMYEKIGIPLNESLLAAVFVEFPETQAHELERLQGKHRQRRSEAWIRQVEL